MDENNLFRWIRAELFDKVLFSIAVIDRDYNVIAANKQFRDTYGSWDKHKCYEIYKRHQQICPGCPATRIFEDGEIRVSQETGSDHLGNPRFYVVHFLPYRNDSGGVKYVIEMSFDITDTVLMEREYRQIFDHVPCYITVIDNKYNILKTNAYLQNTFGSSGAKHCYELYKKSKQICTDCPAKQVFETGTLQQSLQVGVDKHGHKTHYMVTAAPLLADEEGPVSRVIEMALDVSEILELKERLKQAEQEKLEAERLAAVGQTVAGLSHGIKNVLMGLQGGMYVVNSGLRRDDNQLVKQGWSMLQNNIGRISTFVKEFLSFARGTEPKVAMVDPVSIAANVVDLYVDLARQSGIELARDFGDMEEAPMDFEGVHTCLSNLVSNAVDACLASENEDLQITVSCREEDGTIGYTVKDNGCGMDYEVKKKVFTNFFTTKGSGQGTGLGLLVTRKIMHQHGGKITFESTAGKGSTFKLLFPRHRLPTPSEDDGSDK